MQYPTNYDFGANWKSKIVPHLDDPRVKKALQKGINSYLSNWPDNKKYKANTPPANYSSKDCYCMLMDRKEEIYMEELRKSNKLPQEYLDIETNYDNEDGEKFFEIRNKITKSLYEWKNIKYNLESYYVSGSCHSMTPTFELTLARIVEPNEEWRVMRGKLHSTVINKDNTKVFDLNYWCYPERLDNYVFRDDIKEPDITLGGKAAYLDSTY